MPVLTFPAPELTAEDEAAILAAARAGGHYACRREQGEDGRPTIVLLDRDRSVRGRVIKCHGVYAVLDARSHAVVRTRRCDEMLAALAK